VLQAFYLEMTKSDHIFAVFMPFRLCINFESIGLHFERFFTGSSRHPAQKLEKHFEICRL
jgi:hypothetical protein